jgi:hypothetical protein
MSDVNVITHNLSVYWFNVKTRIGCKTTVRATLCDHCYHSECFFLSVYEIKLGLGFNVNTRDGWGCKTTVKVAECDQSWNKLKLLRHASSYKLRQVLTS